MSSEWIGLDQVVVQREVDEAELAAIAFLARYSGRTLEVYRQDLRFFFSWTASIGLEILAATRPHIELFRHHMEQRGLAASRSSPAPEVRPADRSRPMKVNRRGVSVGR